MLSKIKVATTKQDKSVLRLEPLELPTPISKRGKLQPLTTSTARSLEDNNTVDKLLGRPKNADTAAIDTSLSITTNKDSTGHTRSNDAMNSQRTSTDTQLKKQVGIDGDKAAIKSNSSLQLSTASIPSEISEEEDEDLENLTEEGILEKLIALPSHSGDDDDEDLNKVTDDVLKQKKQEMDKEFEQNQVKPGDKGYEYDKEIDFDGDDKVSCGWDSSNSDIEYF